MSECLGDLKKGHVEFHRAFKRVSGEGGGLRGVTAGFRDVLGVSGFFCGILGHFR